MSLSDVISVTVSTVTRTPSRTGFGTPLVVGYHTKFAERLRYYTTLAGLVTDGFATTSMIYRACAAIMAQNPRPPRVAVGRMSAANTMTVDCVPVAQNSHLYTVTINGVAFTTTSDPSGTQTEIIDALVTAINLGTEPVTASNAATKLHLVEDVAGVGFTLDVDRADFSRIDVTADTAGIATQLAAISAEDDTWYGVIPVDQSEAIYNACATYIETTKKFAFYTTADTGVLASGTTTDIVSDLKAGSFARSAIIWSGLPHQYAGAAMFGEEGPKDPGSSTYAYKELASITVDTFTPTEEATLQTKRANYYMEVGGLNVVQQGKTPSGEFIDVTIFVDWFCARLQERLFFILANRDKIPYTDAGATLIEGAVRAQLREGVKKGGLDDDEDTLIVTVPLVADQSDANRAARIFPDVTFSGRLAGAVHEIDLTGTVSA